MEIKTLDFLVGLMAGAALGVGLTLGVIKVRAWLGVSEGGRLKSENRSLRRRLAEKDRHIGRMLSETERLAERLAAGELAEIKRLTAETQRSQRDTEK